MGESGGERALCKRVRRRSHPSYLTSRLAMKRFALLCLPSLALVYRAKPAQAHTGQPLAPHDLWQRWNLDWLLLLGLAMSIWLYARGVRQVWRRAGVGRGVKPAQIAAFVGALVVLAVALLSPLDALSSVLFSAHMGQHLLLIAVAAPLLILGAPPAVWWWALPRSSRRPVARWWHGQQLLHHVLRWITHPLTAWLLHTLALWIWHAPILYQAALDHEAIHALEHLGFFGTALLFWWVLLQPATPGNLHYGIGMLLSFTTALHSGLLGALLTFAPSPWIPAYRATAAAWGLSPLADQQLAGVIMWVPAGVVYLATTLSLLALWLRALERAESPLPPRPVER
jgi:putative membrane protein